MIYFVPNYELDLAMEYMYLLINNLQCISQEDMFHVSESTTANIVCEHLRIICLLQLFYEILKKNNTQTRPTCYIVRTVSEIFIVKLPHNLKIPFCS